MDLIDWEKMAVLICAVLLSIGSALIVVISISYFFVNSVKRDLDRQGKESYNLRLLKQYAPALKLIFLKLTPMSYKEADLLATKVLSTGYVDLRLEKGAIKLNGETIPIEPSKNDPGSLTAIDGVLKALNSTTGKLGYWLSVCGAAGQHIPQTPLDFFQHITGICYTHLNEQRNIRITLDRFGMIVTKHDCQNNLLSKQTIKIVTTYPELHESTEAALPSLTAENRIRRWETA